MHSRLMKRASAEGLIDGNGEGRWDIMAKVDTVTHNLITVGNEGCGLLEQNKDILKALHYIFWQEL
jgi:hypothetical protein